jgi:membrane-bound lytic murein transglycosylase D
MKNHIILIKITQTILLFLLVFFTGVCSKHPKVQSQSAQKPSIDNIEIQDQKKPELPQSQKKQEDIPEVIPPDNNDYSIPIEQDPQDILEEALDAYQDAQNAWEKGDIETSLAALDEAYSLILKLDLPPESPLIQDKNDLRLMIARRIHEVYASREIVIGNNNASIPLVENNFVKKEIKRFQTSERAFFFKAYKRSGLYREMILSEMKKAGLPEYLIWIPLIESGFNVRAYSRARALGLWQFISSTGYRFGLKKNRWIDERMDPVKSTRAAIQYLNELHSLFGDWTTALASYNCGEFKVQRVIRSQRINYLDNFWDLYIMLPRETSRFVPRFIAALLIIENPEKYGLQLPEPDPPIKFETVTIYKPMKLSSLSKSLGLDKDILSFYNPELRHKSTPDFEYELRVPLGYKEKALLAIQNQNRWIPPEATYVIHYVRRGETLSEIARRYRTSIRAIAKLNRLRRLHLIRPGQRLKVPSKNYSGRSSRHSSFKLVKEGERLVYIVKKGDSLYEIARAMSTTVSRIKELNKLSNDRLSIGQKLIIQPGKPKGAITYSVKSGDTPFDIARRHGMNLQVLLRLNGLTSRSKIYPGQKLWILKN